MTFLRLPITFEKRFIYFSFNSLGYRGDQDAVHAAAKNLGPRSHSYYGVKTHFSLTSKCAAHFLIRIVPGFQFCCCL